MDLTLLPESAEVAATARTMFSRHPAASAADNTAADNTAADATSGTVDGALWGAVVAAGWLDILAVPELDYPRIEAAVCLLDEVGRAQPCAPLQVGLVTRWLATAVPGLAGWCDRLAAQPGLLAALGWTLGERPDLPLRLRRQGSGYRLDGDLGIVREAAMASDLLAMAELDGQPMLVAVPLRADGVSADGVSADGVRVTTIDAVGDLRQARVQLDAVLIGEQDVSPGPGPAQKARADALLLILDAAELTGCAQIALEMTVDHARTRRQFDRPLGAFQAVRHRIADMSSDVAQSRWLLHRSAVSLAQADDDTVAAAVTQAHALALWNSVALERVIASAHQVHGGVGFIRDHPLHRYFGRQKASMFSWGQPAGHAASVLAALFPGQEKIMLDL
ncbi:MAG TPA: acyl-CoA dehydrogenase family protein [Streptosporangiaceae bacterium]|jgi:alkylation response protein AidB-like acyl-CoA dehydrogenase